MKLWDGVSWVSHDGVIYKGAREVITYDGLTATPDHFVWVEDVEFPVTFEVAANNKFSLVQTGIGNTPIQLGSNFSGFKSKVTKKSSRKVKVYDILNSGENHRFTISNKLVHNCGYGGSVGALTAMGALDMGLKEDELKPLVTAWRESNPKIVELWWSVDKAVKAAIITRTATQTHGLKFINKSGLLRITLPSGRQLTYIKPKIEMNKFGGESVTYEGVGTAKKWDRIESYGPKFVENIVQAIARDILVYSLQNLSKYRIVAHVHDEVIIEAPIDTELKEICEIMSEVPT